MFSLSTTIMSLILVIFSEMLKVSIGCSKIKQGTGVSFKF